MSCKQDISKTAWRVKFEMNVIKDVYIDVIKYDVILRENIYRHFTALTYVLLSIRMIISEIEYFI